MKYRKKPVIVDAVQWNGILSCLDEIKPFDRTVELAQSFMEREPAALIINTLEGDMRADYGDWIIKGVNGEIYPCKPDIFEATYESVDQ